MTSAPDKRSRDSLPPDPPPGQRWQALLWFGVGVLVAGVGVLGYALAVADGAGAAHWTPRPASR